MKIWIVSLKQYIIYHSQRSKPQSKHTKQTHKANTQSKHTKQPQSNPQSKHIKQTHKANHKANNKYNHKKQWKQCKRFVH